MCPVHAKLVAACLLLGFAGNVHAGGIHIRYGPDAPERLAAENVRYYEGLLNLEHNHPLAFAHEHPFYAKLLHDPVMMENLIARWEAHPQRFEYWHPCLWKVLDGYEHTHPSRAGQIVVLENPINPGGVGTAERNGSPPGGGGGSGPSGGGEGNAPVVPEPSSGLLMVLGAVLASAWAALRGRLRARH
jgi:hypothetical protein